LLTGKKKPSTLGILKYLNVRRRVDLTPGKGCIYDVLKEAKKKTLYLIIGIVLSKHACK